MTDAHPMACPVPDAHRRLMDCHVHWHAALDEYMEPDGFRLNLNSLIQGLRNVTWLLQKRKTDLPGFANWYPAWQEAAKDDDVMQWVVKARNRIVKESDLELHSLAKLRVSLDWLYEREQVFTVPPRWRPRDIAGMLLQNGIPPIPEGEGSLTIERRWVDDLLPSWELLSAALHAYGRLAEIVRVAHDACDVRLCDLRRRDRPCVNAELEGSPECMWLDSDIRQEHFDLGSMTPLVSRRYRVKRDPEAAALAEAKYGTMSQLPNARPVEQVLPLYEVGKRMLSVDGSLLAVAYLFKGDQVVDLQSPVYSDQATKRLAMNTLALRVKMLEADGFVYMCESWFSPAPSDDDLRGGNYPYARDHPERTEGIQIFAITKSGEFMSLTSEFERSEEGTIVFQEPVVDTNPGSPYVLGSILKVWGIDVKSPFET